MNAKSINIGSNLSKVDAHVITAEEYEEIPELTDDFFERADEYFGEKLIRSGSPKAGKTKVSTTVRFDAEVLEAFKASGRGWQTRMNDALKEWLKEHPPA